MARQAGESGERGFTLGDAPTAPNEPHPGDSLPMIDFSTFAMSLATSALYHMGFVNDPAIGATGEKNLPLARQAIDTLEMLARKTRGNLDEPERKLLESLLYELRMRFVEFGK